MNVFWITLLILNTYNIHQTFGIDEIYEPAETLCERCTCKNKLNINYILDCSSKNLNHIMANLPESYFGGNHTGKQFSIIYSGNSLKILQQFPLTDGFVYFSCRFCNIENIKPGLFIDAVNVKRLDLSHNNITSDALVPQTFRGKYDETKNEFIKLEELILSFNKISILDSNLFEHTPFLRILSLSHNPIDITDLGTNIAISSAKSLESLDLSYTGISTLSSDMLKPLHQLKVINIQGNKFTKVPESLIVIHESLRTLYLGENLIEKFDDESFLGLTSLSHLNISHLPHLNQVSGKSFKPLELLEVLIATDNHNLTRFDYTSLKKLTKLREIDLRNCMLKSFEITIDDDQSDENDIENFSEIRSIKLEGNPWHCDCEIYKYLKEINYNDKLKLNNNEARCKTPYELSGTLLLNLNQQEVCSMHELKKANEDISTPPDYLRPRFIIITILIIVGIVLIGLIIGFGIVTLKKHLRQTDIGIPTSVRYTSAMTSSNSFLK